MTVLEQIDANTDAQSVARVVELLGRDVEIQLWLDGYRAADKEGIAHLNTGQDVLVVVLILQRSTQVKTVLLDVVTATNTQGEEVVSVLRVVKANLDSTHDVIHKEVTGLGIQTEMEFLGLTADINTRERSAKITLPLFKLCVGGH